MIFMTPQTYDTTTHIHNINSNICFTLNLVAFLIKLVKNLLNYKYSN